MTASSDVRCWICRERGVLPVREPPSSLCGRCSTTLTQPYDGAWAQLCRYLQGNWKDIVSRGNFDLSRIFGSQAAAGALHVHLHFIKLLGCRLLTDKINVDLSGFADSLKHALPHPDITLLVADCTPEGRKLRYYDTESSVLARDDDVYSALWMHLAFPVAVKVCYVKRAAPVLEPDGFPWHPDRQRKIVKLSPYKGDTRPLHARRDLRM